MKVPQRNAWMDTENWAAELLYFIYLHHCVPHSFHYALSQYMSWFQMLPFESTIGSTSGMLPDTSRPRAFDKVTALPVSCIMRRAVRGHWSKPRYDHRRPNTIPLTAKDGHWDKRRRMIFSRSMCFPLTLSYAAVPLSCLGHQLTSRR